MSLGQDDSGLPAPPGSAVISDGVDDTALRGRAVQSGLVRTVGQILMTIIGIGSGMALARLLTPEDFGLVALVGAFTAFISTFRDFGLPMATVHWRSLSGAQLSALFWLNIKLSGLVLLVIVLAGPLLARFFDEPRLTGIAVGTGIALFALSLSAQHEALLARQMRFGRLTMIELGGMVVGVTVGILLALRGFGFWALVYQLVATNAAKSVLMWSLTGWRPRRANGGERVDLSDFISYGGNYAGFKILNHLGKRIDRVLLGTFGGVTAVGFYDNALRWAYFPLDQLYTPLLNVMVSALSRVQGDLAAYRSSAMSGLLPVLSLLMPALVFAFVEAEKLILLLLGDQWVEAIPLFRLLALAALAESVTRITKWLYLSQGETRRQLRWTMVATPLMIGAMAFGVRWGALGMTIGYTSATWVLAYPRIAYCLKTSHLTMSDFATVLWRPALASLLAAGAWLAGESLIPPSGPLLVDLLAGFALFALGYLIAWVALPGGRRAARDIFELFLEAFYVLRTIRNRLSWLH